MTRRLACTAFIAWQASRNAQGGVVSHPHLLHVHLPDASGGATTTGGCDAGFFLARIPSGGGKRDGDGDMGDCLLSGLSRRPGSTVFATYQLGVIDQVGGPPAPAVRGSIVGATSRLLRSLA